MSSNYSKSDAASDTGVSTSHASSAWHQARNDCAKAANKGDSFAKKLTKGWGKRRREK